MTEKNQTLWSRSASAFVSILSITSLLAVDVSVAYADALTIGAGDTAAAAPDVNTICKAMDNVETGKLVDINEKPLTFTKESCMSYTRRRREGPECQATASQLVAAGESANPDALCARGTTELNQSAAAFCTLKELIKTQQAGVYCKAYNSAKHAQKGLTAMLAIDGSAAAVCWVENFSLKTTQAGMDPGPIEDKARQKGTCSYASLGAGVAEIINIILANAGPNNHATGEYKIDSDGNKTKKDDEDGVNITKILDIVMSSGLSLAVIRNGVCGLSRSSAGGSAGGSRAGNIDDPRVRKVCGFLAKKLGADHSNESDFLSKTGGRDSICKMPIIQINGHQDPNQLTEYNACIARIDAADAQKEAAKKAYLASDATAKGMTAASDAALTAKGDSLTLVRLSAARTLLQPRIDLAKSSAMMLTALAAIRGVSLSIASSTEKRAKETLQSMFDPNGSGTTYGTSGVSGQATNIYSPGSNAFTPSTTSGVSTSAITAGSPESFLLPKGSPLADAAEKLAQQIPAKKLLEAASSGAGVGGLISSMASGMGAKDTGEIRNAASSAYGAIPSSGSDSYKGGGGKSLAKGGDSTPDLNLKGLFGGGDKEEHAAADGDFAYRGPASDDIWHSKNPKGNNLFQIVSERYDTTQRSRDLSP